MWFFFAITYSLLTAVVIIFDRFSVKFVFTRPLQGLFITSLVSFITCIALFPFAQLPDLQILAISIGAGISLGTAQLCYFKAMERTNHSGDLSAVESTYPVLIAIVSIFLGYTLKLQEWVGIFIIVICTTAISWNKLRRIDVMYFLFLGIDIIALAVHGLLIDFALSKIDFFTFYLPYNIGILIFGIAPYFISNKERYAFSLNWLNIQKLLPKLAFMECINVIATASAIIAIKLYHPAIVTTVMTTYPAIIFIILAVFHKMNVLQEWVSEKENSLGKKMLLTVLIACGLGLIAI